MERREQIKEKIKWKVESENNTIKRPKRKKKKDHKFKA